MVWPCSQLWSSVPCGGPSKFSVVGSGSRSSDPEHVTEGRAATWQVNSFQLFHFCAWRCIQGIIHSSANVAGTIYGSMWLVLFTGLENGPSLPAASLTANEIMLRVVTQLLTRETGTEVIFITYFCISISLLAKIYFCLLRNFLKSNSCN